MFQYALSKTSGYPIPSIYLYTLIEYNTILIPSLPIHNYTAMLYTVGNHNKLTFTNTEHDILLPTVWTRLKVTNQTSIGCSRIYNQITVFVCLFLVLRRSQQLRKTGKMIWATLIIFTLI